MSEQELQDPVLLAVRNARPAIDDAVLSPTGADALKVLERVLQGEDPRLLPELKATRGQRRIRRRRIPASRRVWRPRIGVIAIATAAVVAAAVIVLSGISEGPSLVARAYAAVNPAYQILHEVDIRNDPGVPGWSERDEAWLLPADGRARLISIWGYKRFPFVSEWIITATGRAFGRTCLSGCRPASFINGSSGWGRDGNVTPGTFGGPQGTLPGTFAQWFRAAYRAGAVVPEGTTTFAGKHVARFESMVAGAGPAPVSWRPGTPPPLGARSGGFYALIDWYIDPATARPVGFNTWGCMSNQVRACERRQAAPATVRIVTFERLDPTPQALALLTGPHAPAGAR